MNAAELSAAIVDGLAAAGTDTVFGLPGGGNNLDFIGAVEAAGLRFILAHAETPAAIMAAVYADLTQAPAACLVTRGPGAASTVNGIANAMLDRQSVVLVTDAVSSTDYERIAHQRIDQRQLFHAVTKWSATTGSGDVRATVQHALATAEAPPRGPVHLDFDPTARSTDVPQQDEPAQVEQPELDRVADLLSRSSRPVVVLGVGSRSISRPVRTLLRDSHVPVLMTYRAKGVIPDSWLHAAGHFTGATTEGPLLEAADLIVMIGVDSVELIPNSWPYAAPVVSVAGWADTSPYVRTDVELVGDLAQLVAFLAEHWPATSWLAGAGNAHRDSELLRLLAAGGPASGGLRPQVVVQRTHEAAPDRSLATVDAGAHMLPAMSLWPAEDVDEVLISSGLATMGFALPAAIGAALARRGRRVVCFTGDGGLGMSLGELETLRRLDLPITVVVFNDSRLSLIAIKAKPVGHGGENAIAYASTDFAAVARGYGIHGARASTTEDLDAGLSAAFSRPGPSLVDVRVDPTGYLDILDAIRGPRGDKLRSGPRALHGDPYPDRRMAT